ncbi:conserved unknown protein [Ectocarpus siliculosus]|uniref:Uncharacterized protein n=1 Tax=Ectocarpus siliculosus TaxID=2880 RepID=D7G4J0_ECTSI|nr:conserved unknown protein [Ectocarpus siliculosus]|eukprot:CBJ48893.1 conserved unknown protein [Ectocarpus siliculosus]
MNNTERSSSSGNALVEALANGGGGAGEAAAGGFGLGVGLALSPELAQKVRECHGVSSAPVVSESSLTFLRAAPGGTANGSVGPSELQQQPQEEQQQEQEQQQRHRDDQEHRGGIGTDAAAATKEGLVTPSSVPLATNHNETTDTPVSAVAGGNSDLNGACLGCGDRGEQGTQGGGQDACAELCGDAGASNLSDRRQDGDIKQAGDEREGTCGGHREEGGAQHDEERRAAAAAVAEEDDLAEPPDSWEEFDESTVPPVAPAAAAVAASAPREENGLKATAKAAAVGGADSASSACLESKLEERGRLSASDGGGEASGAGGTPEEKAHPELSSVPVLLVDLARVCGFRVKGAEEADIVGGKVRAALHESFAERSEELFETGSAVHADTSTLAEEMRRRSEASSMRSSWAVVDYPAMLGGGVSTSEAWSAVTTPSPCRAVEAVRTALLGTNRHLVWKRDMLAQLEAVATSERDAKEKRLNAERQAELEAWRERRREQLERLIEVRPMFERRRAMAEEKLIAAGGGVDGGPGGLGDGAAADPVSAAVVQSLDAKLEDIDDLIARLEIEEGEEGYGFVPSDDDEDDNDRDDDDDYLYNGENEDDENDYGYDADREASQPPTETAASAAAAAAAGGTTPGKSSGGGGTKASVQPGDVANVAGAAADAAARKQANKKRKKKKKISVVEQLKAKEASGVSGNGVGSVREGGEGNGGKEGGDGSEVTPPPEMGLLDAVAAMILGRFPQDPRASSEEHFQKIAAMHQHMKDAWLEEFGRLPPMA